MTGVRSWRAQSLRFLFAGASNTLASYLLFWILLGWVSPQPAYAVAYVFGLALAYLLNSIFVFRVRIQTRTIPRFLAAYLIPYLVNAALLHLFVERLHIAPALALALALLLTVPMSFVLNRRALRD